MKELDLEYKITGKGEQILVIESGIGGAFYDWYALINDIKEYFTIILYNRAGYGNSKVLNQSRTTKNIAKELNWLLDNIGIKDKFILMGHSFGGLCVQQYVKMYPNKIKGVVLVDSTSYNFKQLYNLNIPVMNSLISIDKMVEGNINSSKKSKKELKNQCKNIISGYKKILSENEIVDCEEFLSNPLLYKTMADEFENWEKSSKSIKEMGEFPDIPLKIIARDNKVAEKYWINLNIPIEEAILYENKWRELQVELSKLCSKGELIIAENSDHEVYLDRPDSLVHCLKSLI
ncbi:alpha/beta fold hydrolase [Abyssisolibacter fermentans]|uniref:alpha/beta fold hydrolase n=1 Tax=Abyssisolibacter fermentans TaxID=1766203 RepID=UPI000832B205|nr:alpha/beta fold hydrolase [Abyssisolibacter fermentans]